MEPLPIQLEHVRVLLDAWNNAERKLLQEAAAALGFGDTDVWFHSLDADYETDTLALEQVTPGWWPTKPQKERIHQLGFIRITFVDQTGHRYDVDTSAT